MSRYAELLKDPRWQRRRLEVLERDGWRCTSCESADKTLHVHHRRYAKSGLPWDVAPEDLLTLCEDCHAEESGLDSAIRGLLPSLDACERWMVLGYIKGRVFQSQDGQSAAPFVPDLENGEDLDGFLQSFNWSDSQAREAERAALIELMHARAKDA